MSAGQAAGANLFVNTSNSSVLEWTNANEQNRFRHFFFKKNDKIKLIDRAIDSSAAAQNNLNENEPRHDKTNKVTVRPAKTQIRLGIRPV